MRTIKQVLLLVLVALLAGHVATAVYRGSSDRKIGPKLTCEEGILEISTSDPESALLAGITASDAQDGDLTDRIIVAGISKLISNNTAKVTYLVFDSDDNMDTYIRRICYVDYHKPYFTVDPTKALIYPTNTEVSVLDRVGAVDLVDKDISEQVRVSTLAPTSDPEIYDITVQVTNSLGDTAWLTLPVQVLGNDPTRPTVQLKEQLVYLEKGQSFDPRSYLLGVQLADGTQLDATNVTMEGTVDTSVVDGYRVTFSYDHNGSVGRAILTVVVL